VQSAESKSHGSLLGFSLAEMIQPWRIVFPGAVLILSGEKTRATKSIAPLPEQRIKVRALFPGTVAKAAMGESSPYWARIMRSVWLPNAA
jgi:hypothetical protein